MVLNEFLAKDQSKSGSLFIVGAGSGLALSQAENFTNLIGWYSNTIIPDRYHSLVVILFGRNNNFATFPRKLDGIGNEVAYYGADHGFIGKYR